MKNEHKFDMHFHSIRSDGANSTYEILRKASELGLSSIFLTDHDVISTYDFIKKAEDLGIYSANSVEISALNYENGKYIHLTSYAKNFGEEIYDILNNTLDKKQGMIKAQVNKLAEKGFDINIDSFLKNAEKNGKKINSINKYNISDYLLKNEKNIDIIKEISGNNNPDVVFFLKEFLKEGGKFNDEYLAKIPEYEPSIEKTGELAEKNNAILSIAHPDFSFGREGITGFKKSLPYYLDKGVNAIEINSKANKEWVETIYDLKKKYNLVLTAGSDCHEIGTVDNKHGDFGLLNPLLSEDDKNLIIKEFKNKIN